VCLAIPARVLSIEQVGAWVSGTVSVGGAERSVDLSLVPDVTVGDFVVTHAGYAISVISHARAVETLEMLDIDPG
jgi:hydrogenase expression/formation protein HypC